MRFKELKICIFVFFIVFLCFSILLKGHVLAACSPRCAPNEICQQTCGEVPLCTGDGCFCETQGCMCTFECASYGGGEDTFSCPAGTHDNGRCVPGEALNPPCCSADVTVTPTSTLTPTPTVCVGSCAGKVCGQDNGCGTACPNTGATTWGAYSPSTWCGTVTRTSYNSCGGSRTITSTCTECGPTVTRSTCNATTHTRTVTANYNCSADTVVTEDCTGEIRGTLFDATNLSSCPSFDPSTGYLIGVDTTLTANNRTFGFADQNNTSPHPWSPLTTAQTNSSGNYSVRVYAPTTYTYDFSSFSDIYVVSSGPKLTCTSTTAVVPGSSTGCTTQPCSIVNNMSFGFERYWGGWWQVVGAGVHGQNGLKSSIPNSYPSEQSLILGDGTAANRSGVASYGTLVNEMLGINPSAKVSTNLWQVQSSYQGSRYDHDYFNQQFKKYIVTTWNGSDSIVYNDGGRGYQIFKVTGDVTSFSYNPTGTEKVIFLVDGNVTVSSNITVPSGAYLALLSSGDISFSTSVTRADGWYLANNINVRCTDANTDLTCDRTDVQFLGNGSFVGWQGVNLSRDRGATLNQAGPAEKFTYRKDLYENAPEPMKIVTKRYEPYVP